MYSNKGFPQCEPKVAAAGSQDIKENNIGQKRCQTCTPVSLIDYPATSFNHNVKMKTHAKYSLRLVRGVIITFGHKN